MKYSFERKCYTHLHAHTHVYIEALKYIRIYPRSGMMIYWTHFSAFLCSTSLEISFIKSCRGCWQSETKISSDAISDARLRMNLLTNTLTYKHTHTHTHTQYVYAMYAHTSSSDLRKIAFWALLSSSFRGYFATLLSSPRPSTSCRVFVSESISCRIESLNNTYIHTYAFHDTQSIPNHLSHRVWRRRTCMEAKSLLQRSSSLR